MKKLDLFKMVCIAFVFCAATAIASPAQTLTTLHSFDGADGWEPYAGLVLASDGHFYGTTHLGGANDRGTVFKITPSGTLTPLYSFGSQPDDGADPWAGLVQATDGNFYGTTQYGGANGGWGTVFKIAPGGTLTTLYSFCSQSNCADGEYPYAPLVQARDGNFYGTTFEGGNSDSSCPYGNGTCGTAFKITPSGTLTTLYSFCSQSNCSDGGNPLAGLVQATDGNLYGTTYYGGASGAGTVFKITPSGTLATLHSFDGSDGSGPYAGLVQASDGNLYGTTVYGGANDDGTVFKITPGGALSTLYSFCSQTNCGDGWFPAAGLVQASDGNLYGTTVYGGASGNCSYGCGTLFKITPGGMLTTLHSFNGADGNYPYFAGLVQGTDGNFYGTTSAGGASDNGTVFRLVSERPCFSCALQW